MTKISGSVLVIIIFLALRFPPVSVAAQSGPVHDYAAPCPINGSGKSYVMVYRSQYWEWYATPDRWNQNCRYYLEQATFPDEVYRKLKDFLADDPIHRTPDKRFYLLINEQTGGGFAAAMISEINKGPGIGIAWDAWNNPYTSDAYWSHELIAHETVNQFTAMVVSGWPVDWWADHRSPFPFMVKTKLLESLGYQMAVQADLEKADTLVRMFRNLQEKYGWEIYRTMLRNVINDGWVSWDTLTTNGGTNPSRLRSSYIAAYLSMAAKSNLTPMLNERFIDAKLGYVLDPLVIDQIMQRRTTLEKKPKQGEDWLEFRAGKYR